MTSDVNRRLREVIESIRSEKFDKMMCSRFKFFFCREPFSCLAVLEWEGKEVCDLQELYRHLVDDFLVQYCLRLKKKDFTTKAESVSRKRRGKREYLNGGQTRHLMKQLNAFFEAIVEVPRIRIGGRQTIETLINEEALLLAKYLRNERETWSPRIAIPN